MTKNTTLSVVVPAYKAEKFIVKSLLNIKASLDKERYDYEIICVVDGKVDRTWSEAKKISRRFPKKIKVIGYSNNMGKGHAVRFGMAEAAGDIVGFMDAGTDLNPFGLRMLLSHMEWYEADIVIGSKRHPASKVLYPTSRKILSIGYQTVVRILFGLKVRDSQVGMKFFRRKVLKDLLPRILVKAFAFDIEMLAVANYLGYERIFEAPVELNLDFTSSTIVSKGFARTIFYMLWDTVAVFYRLRILRYYDSKNRRQWITPKYLTFSKQ